MPPPNPLQSMLGMLDLLGINIFEAPELEPKPKFKLSPACPVSDEFRAEMDSWLLDMFGVDIGDDGLIAMRSPFGIHMAPSMIRALKSDNMTAPQREPVKSRNQSKTFHPEE